MNFLLEPFAFLIRVFNDWTGHYLLALLLFAVLIKIVLIPFGISQQKRSVKNAKLRPKIALIEKKYAGRTDQRTMQKKQQEIMDLQQAEGFSPLAGCLPMIIQLVLIIFLYGIVTAPLTYICQFDEALRTTLAEAAKVHLGLAQNAAAPSEIQIVSLIPTLVEKGAVTLTPDQLASLPNLSLWGLDFAANPIDVGGWMIVLPFLVFLVQFGTMKLTRLMMKNDPTQQAQGANSRGVKISNWIMDLSMPALSLYFAFTFPGALGVYWIYQGILGAIQSVILYKVMPLPTFTEEDLKAYEKEVKGKNPKYFDVEKPRVRSLHHIDDEDDGVTEPGATAPMKKEAPLSGAPEKKDEAPKLKEEPDNNKK